MTNLLRAAMSALLIAAIGPAALAAFAPAAHADEAGDEKAKLEAKALLQSGNTFFEKGAYAQALDLFRAAYARYPSTKVLFNIAKTLQAMGRHREAASTFDTYLSRPDSDPARRTEILDVIRQIEPKIGKLVFKTLDAQARITVDGESTTPGGSLVRVDPGDHMVRIEKPGFLPVELTVSVSAGEEKNVDVRLSPEPPAAPQATRVAVRTEPKTGTETGPDTTTPVAGTGERVDGVAPAPSAGGRLAITVRAVFDHEVSGAAVQPGLEIALDPRVSVIAAATVGPTFGGYVGARVRILPGRIRPLISAGVPVFAFDGVRFGVRGAGGVEAALGGRFSLSLELGVEHYFVKDVDMLETTVFAPAAAVNARL